MPSKASNRVPRRDRPSAIGSLLAATLGRADRIRTNGSRAKRAEGRRLRSVSAADSGRLGLENRASFCDIMPAPPRPHRSDPEIAMFSKINHVAIVSENYAQLAQF